MNYLILIIFFAAITWIISKRTFYWETVIKYLWKQIYQLANLMASEIHAGSNETLWLEKYKKSIDARGKLINAIIDYVNSDKDLDDEDAEEETFKHGRFDFDTILLLAKSDPDAFKNFK